MSEPKSRVQRWPLPQSAPVIAEAARRRAAWLDAMAAVSNSHLTEHEREARDDDALDNSDLQE